MSLGLPDGIHGCLFDLDGVLTKTAYQGSVGYVVGVHRAGQAAALKSHGAEVVVTDLADLLDRA